MNYTQKEYLIVTGSDSEYYINSHSFTVLKTVELVMDGESVRMVQMRNPWKTDDGWKGDYSVKQGGAKYDQLKAALEVTQGGIKIEAGKFWISFDDFTREYSDFIVGHSQETRTPGGEERADYRPTIDLD